MRIAKLFFVGPLGALVLVAAPALAKNSDGQKTEDKQASASCQAYQQAPDGSWMPLPCGEIGPSPRRTPRADRPTNAVGPNGGVPSCHFITAEAAHAANRATAVAITLFP